MRRILSVTVLLAVLTACSPFDDRQPDETALANAYYGEKPDPLFIRETAQRYLQVHDLASDVEWQPMDSVRGSYSVKTSAVHYGYLLTGLDTDGTEYTFVFKNDLITVVTANGLRIF
jgi:hypothetical protein|tara:strand:- start:198 stop:548 length:351 start_codon:yes stop_codon:yes gene_type:complete